MPLVESAILRTNSYFTWLALKTGTFPPEVSIGKWCTLCGSGKKKFLMRSKPWWEIEGHLWANSGGEKKEEKKVGLGQTTCLR